MASVIDYCETWIKDPDAILDYTIDWGPNWLSDGETISTSTWIVPANITEDSDSNDDTTATIWLSGGVEGESYDITNRITTSAGRQDDRSFQLIMCQR